MANDLHKIGDWDKVRRVIAKLADEAQKARLMSLQRWGLKAEGLAKKHMSNQDLGWRPLEPATIAEKVRKGYSENILVRTSSYFQSITSWVDKTEGVSYAGVRKTARNRDGDALADIAAVHEYGSRNGNIPARPLWHPVFGETMEWFMQSDSRPDVLFMNNMKKYL